MTNSDKFAATREMSDKWLEILLMLYNPEMYVTMDKQLGSFLRKKSIKTVYVKKPAKYGVKFWVLCGNATNYALNIQLYLGEHPGSRGLKF